MDVGYRAGVSKDVLKGIKFLYLLGEVCTQLYGCLLYCMRMIQHLKLHACDSDWEVIDLSEY